MTSKIKVIGFDADDTLWVNEPNYKEAESEFCKLMLEYGSEKKSSEELFRAEMKNLGLYGYGAKAFMLSLIETALIISNYKLKPEVIHEIIDLGKKLLNKPVQLLHGVEYVLKELNGKYKLIMASKGDLLDQERKLDKSGLSAHFHHIEIMSNKEVPDYEKLLKNLEIHPDEFLMVGNSIRSDILPVLQIGGYATHIPYHTTWQYEKLENTKVDNPRFREVSQIEEILQFLL